MAGFDSVYVAACPQVDWAADLPEGAFSEYDSRGAVIPKGEDRAIKLTQLRSFATLIKQVIGWEDSAYNPQNGPALDAIVSDNLEEFKVAMLTIHSSEQVYESGEAALEARTHIGLPPDSGCVQPDSLAR